MVRRYLGTMPTSWTGTRIQALSLHRKVGSDGWLPTRGILSREHYPFWVLYAYTLQQVREGYRTTRVEQQL